MNGLLVEDQNEKKMQEAIEMLIGDEELRIKLGEKAVDVREKYSIEKIAKEWEKIINKVIDK